MNGTWPRYLSALTSPVGWTNIPLTYLPPRKPAVPPQSHPGTREVKSPQGLGPQTSAQPAC